MDLANAIAVAAVVVALLALIWQAREASRQARLLTFTSYTERYQQIMLNLPSDIESESFDVGALDDGEREVTLRWLRAYYDLCSEEHHLWNLRWVDRRVWNLWSAGMRDSMRRPAFKFAWRQLQAFQYYPKEFGEFVGFVTTQRGRAS